MNKLYRLLLLCSTIMCVSIVPLTAEEPPSDIYYINTQIVKIFQHRKGFYVVYRKANSEAAEIFIPNGWFKQGSSKADIKFINTRVRPYLSFFIHNGECDYVRIMAPKNEKAPAWGTLAAPQQYDEKFEGIEKITNNF